MKRVAEFKEFVLEPVVIVNDAVVNDSNFAALIQVRMAVGVGGRPVRGPARVADAELADCRFAGQKQGKAFIDLSLLLSNDHVPVAQDGDAGAVVSAIFQPAQSFEEDGRRGFFTDVTYNSAHNAIN